MSRIGIFGGTFNPPHLAHKRLVLEAYKNVNLDKIIIIPTNIPPHKENKDLLSGNDRFELCKKTFFEDVFEISDIEIKRQGRSFTVETLEILKKVYPEDDLFFIIGSDMLLSFDCWYRYKDILKMVRLIVTTRENEVNNSILMQYAKNKLNLNENNIFLLDIEPKVLSSTEIREKIKNNESIEGLITQEASDFIKSKGFYR